MASNRKNTAATTDETPSVEASSTHQPDWASVLGGLQELPSTPRDTGAIEAARQKNAQEFAANAMAARMPGGDSRTYTGGSVAQDIFAGNEFAKTQLTTINPTTGRAAHLESRLAPQLVSGFIQAVGAQKLSRVPDTIRIGTIGYTNSGYPGRDVVAIYTTVAREDGTRRPSRPEETIFADFKDFFAAIDANSADWAGRHLEQFVCWEAGAKRNNFPLGHTCVFPNFVVTDIHGNTHNLGSVRLFTQENLWNDLILVACPGSVQSEVNKLIAGGAMPNSIADLHHLSVARAMFGYGTPQSLESIHWARGRLSVRPVPADPVRGTPSLVTDLDVLRAFVGTPALVPDDQGNMVEAIYPDGSVLWGAPVPNGRVAFGLYRRAQQAEDVRRGVGRAAGLKPVTQSASITEEPVF